MNMSMAAAEEPTGWKKNDCLITCCVILFVLLSYTSRWMQRRTYKSKDVPNGGDKDDQAVGASQQDYSDDNVADPAEFLGGTQELVDRGPNLERDKITSLKTNFP